MNRLLGSSRKERKELFTETARRMHIGEAAVEKDFWVCIALNTLFANPQWSSQLIFKGGTLLAKCFRIIERFSEDIDLVVSLPDFDESRLLSDRREEEQRSFETELLQASASWVDSQLLPDLQRALPKGLEVRRKEVNRTPVPEILLLYNAEFSDEYLPAEIKLELGPRSPHSPVESSAVASFAAEQFPDFADLVQVEIRVLSAVQTFWEKATLLHSLAHRPENKPPPARYSRHYYDLARLAGSGVCEQALSRMELLERVSSFKAQFFPDHWTNYSTATPPTFSLAPPPHIERVMRDDYARSIGRIIFSDPPSFDSILETLAGLERRINALGDTIPTPTPPPSPSPPGA